MKAKAWLERGRGRTDPIDSLADFWRGFNHQFDNENGAERDKIRGLLQRKLSPQSSQALLDRHAEEIHYLIGQPIVDMRRNGRDTTEHIRGYRESNDAVEKVIQLFLIIYQIRCNLEHGQKHPDSERDIRLCRCAAPLVAATVELCA